MCVWKEEGSDGRKERKEGIGEKDVLGAREREMDVSREMERKEERKELIWACSKEERKDVEKKESKKGKRER